MRYTKYGDISALLIELCQPFDDNELLELARISAKMSNNTYFDRAYTAEVKNLYLSNLNHLSKGTYKPVRFSDMNSQICERIEQKQPSPTVLLPEYAQFDTHDVIKQQASNLRKRINNLNLKNCGK